MVSRKSERMLGRLFRHDIGGMINVSQASLRPDIDIDTVGAEQLDLGDTDFESISDIEEGDMKDLDETSELGAFEEFVGVAEAASERLSANYALGTVEEEIEYLKQFDLGRVSPEAEDINGPGKHVKRVSDLADAVSSYFDHAPEVSQSSNMLIEDVFETFENYGEVDYNGFDNCEISGDGALCVVANTIALNAKDHGGNPELYAEVEELEDAYQFNIWDNGKALPEEYDPEEIFRRETGDNSGLGLYLAREITEGFGGSLEYSEENAEREDGFGLQWTLAKPESGGGNFRVDDSADYSAD